MDCSLLAPCADCPFLLEGGIRLMTGRIREISEAVAPSRGDGAPFVCHKTASLRGDAQQHCAGAVLYAGHLGRQSQFVQVCERLGVFDRAKLRGAERVFPSLAAWLASALDAVAPMKRKRWAEADLLVAVLAWARRAGGSGTCGECAEALGAPLRRVVSVAQDLSEAGDVSLNVATLAYGAVANLSQRDWEIEPFDDGGVEFEPEEDE